MAYSAAQQALLIQHLHTQLLCLASLLPAPGSATTPNGSWPIPLPANLGAQAFQEPATFTRGGRSRPPVNTQGFWPAQRLCPRLCFGLGAIPVHAKGFQLVLQPASPITTLVICEVSRKTEPALFSVKRSTRFSSQPIRLHDWRSRAAQGGARRSAPSLGHHGYFQPRDKLGKAYRWCSQFRVEIALLLQFEDRARATG